MKSWTYARAPLPAELVRRYAQEGDQIDATLGPLLHRNQEFGHLPAVLDGEMVLSWAELADQAARFAGFLNANATRKLNKSRVEA